MRGLKVFTTLALVLGLGLMVAWPWVLAGRPPKGAPRAQLESFGVWLTGYFSVTLVCFALAAAGALLIVRTTRREYANRRRENLDTLIEGLRADKRRRG